METPAFLVGNLSLLGELFDARLLLVGFGDVARDELFGFGVSGERLDVLAQAFLIFADGRDLGVNGGLARFERGDARLEFDETLEGGGRRCVVQCRRRARCSSATGAHDHGDEAARPAGPQSE